MANLFTKGSHHRNLSVIYIVQNIFHQGTETRNISLNTHYIVVFKSPRDNQQVLTLARQINPGRVPEFMHAYEKATSHPHWYCYFISLILIILSLGGMLIILCYVILYKRLRAFLNKELVHLYICLVLGKHSNWRRGWDVVFDGRRRASCPAKCWL